ncbi:MAG: hypothetical protein LBI67_11975 [Treponema sp.]|jgi:hypothetical protein|nr:hypothetical protein [Treponema sp.]
MKAILQKLKSTKLWITLWAIVMSTKMIWDGQDGTALTMLLAAPLSYMGLNILQDFIFRGGNK